MPVCPCSRACWHPAFGLQNLWDNQRILATSLGEILQFSFYLSEQLSDRLCYVCSYPDTTAKPPIKLIYCDIQRSLVLAPIFQAKQQDLVMQDKKAHG